MDTERYLVLARRWWWFLILAMVVAGGAYIVASRSIGTPPQSTYRASATIFVVYEPDAPRLSAASYPQLIEGRTVMERAIADLGLSDTVETLQARVRAQANANTQLMQVTAVGESAQDAELRADGVTGAFVGIHKERMLPGSVSIYEPARAVQNAAAGGPTLIETLLVALFALTLAGGALLFIDYLSNAVKSSKDAEDATGLAALVTIPTWSPRGGAGRRLAANSERTANAAERYRMLRTSIALKTTEEPASTLLVAAGLPGEGTSTTAANLAVALAQTGTNVALVDTNLRSPSMHKLFDLPNEQGLTQALEEGPATLDAFLQRTQFDSLAVVTSGPRVANPSELLASERFDRLLAALRERFETVVLDSPPALSLTDATVLAAKADASILVVRAEHTGRAQAEAAADSLRRATPRVLGVVFNREYPALRFGLPRLRLGGTKAAQPDGTEADLRPARRTAG